MAPGYYVYRTTTDKLGSDLNRIAECGDRIVTPVHVGGRDWVLICIKAPNVPDFESPGVPVQHDVRKAADHG